ncbi:MULTISPECIES: DnaD domain-containing protein [unclassified Candidatus Frackibacter]|uniref:DnaD domain-containing protein n=1 Tax=unclassified Candidatus Frackibacter TaxID=2648818 RepID=UPI00088CD398|nr:MULTISPECIES: DnaD domain protein [unclassified Candidatus Frackibacter]SDC31607.1 DnaD and phage-associated domain-containing protein [Candidatus Frackibacter sp. WG11]SEM73240.1 DnaD and phage-associated domain-containing protein [Candidatus Frackibacter sp. WG12]SFL59451.1 DnaD and phage-associated domain-containing protein [Candidatus Frackibacter sp. WG13]
MAERLNRAVIKEEFYKLTGHPLKALIINQFLYWTERVRDYDQFIKEERKRARREGTDLVLDETKGWIYKTTGELKEELMVHWHKKTIRNHIKELVELGYLAERQNPKHKFDNTKQYRVNLLKLNKDLMEIGYVLQGYKFDDLIQDEMKRAIQQNNSKLEESNEDSKRNDFGSNRNEVSSERNDFGSRGNDCASSGNSFDTIPETTTETITENKREEEKEDAREDLDKQLWMSIFELYEKVFDKEISDFQLETLRDYISDNQNMDLEIIPLALKEAGLNNANTFSYVITTLDDWLERELTTEDKVLAMKEERIKQNQEAKQSKFKQKKTDKSNYSSKAKVRGSNNYQHYPEEEKNSEIPIDQIKERLKKFGLVKPEEEATT